MMASILVNVTIWASPATAVVVTYLYLRYSGFSNRFGWGMIAIYVVHQTFCLLFLIQSLGVQVASTLLLGPILVVDLIKYWPEERSNPNDKVKNALLALSAILWIFAGAAIVSFFSGF